MTYMPPNFEDPWRRWARMDRVVRMMVGHWALGMTVGALFGAGMILFDAFGLRTLMRHAHGEVVGTILLVASFSLTFGGVVAATAAMRAGQDEDDDPPGGLRAPALAYAAIRAR